MDLYEQILCEAIAKEVIPSLHINYETLLELKCYQAVKKIYQILSDDTIEDETCFEQIEQIVSVLDDLGIGGGGRHDF